MIQLTPLLIAVAALPTEAFFVPRHDGKVQRSFLSINHSSRPHPAVGLVPRPSRILLTRNECADVDGSCHAAINTLLGAAASASENSSETTISSSMALSMGPSLRKARILRQCLLAVIAYMATGVLCFSRIFERWSIVDSLYFSVVTFTTVGYVCV